MYTNDITLSLVNLSIIVLEINMYFNFFYLFRLVKFIKCHSYWFFFNLYVFYPEIPKFYISFIFINVLKVCFNIYFDLSSNILKILYWKKYLYCNRIEIIRKSMFSFEPNLDNAIKCFITFMHTNLCFLFYFFNVHISLAVHIHVVQS